MSSALIEKVGHAEVATVARDEKESRDASKLLELVVEKTEYSREDIVRSLTIPPGEEYLETTMLRFLRARNGDLDKALAMISEAMAFRAKNDLDNILSKPLAKVLLRHLRKGVYDGILPSFDKLGRPVYLLQGGASNHAIHGLLDPPEGYEHWTIKDLEDVWVQWHLIQIEYLTKVIMAEATKNAGKLINKYVVIDDIKGFSLKGVKGLMNVMSLFKKCADIDQLLWPECLSFMVFINAPALFRAPWKVIASFIDKETVAKISMMGGKSQYEPVLDFLFDKSQLPPFLEGNLDGNHVTCLENPDTHTYDEIDRLCLENATKRGYPVEKRSKQMETLKVDSGKTTTSYSVTPQPGDFVEWQITVESHDIAYRVVFTNDRQETILLQEGKARADDVRCSGEFLAKEPGQVHVLLDNSKSRFRSKTVRYRLFVWTPINEGSEPQPSPTVSTTATNVTEPDGVPLAVPVPVAEEQVTAEIVSK